MRGAVAVLLCGLALALGQSSDGFQPGRATFYDECLPVLLEAAPHTMGWRCARPCPVAASHTLRLGCAARGSPQYLKNFPRRGPPPEYGFGTALYGSCGYTSQAGTGSVDFSDVVRSSQAPQTGALLPG